MPMPTCWPKFIWEKIYPLKIKISNLALTNVNIQNHNTNPFIFVSAFRLSKKTHFRKNASSQSSFVALERFLRTNYHSYFIMVFTWTCRISLVSSNQFLCYTRQRPFDMYNLIGRSFTPFHRITNKHVRG